MSGERCTGACCERFALTGLGRTPEVIRAFLLARGLDGFDQAVATVDEPLMCLAPTGRETVIGQLLVEFPSCLAWHLTSYKRTWPHLDDLIVMFNTQGAR